MVIGVVMVPLVVEIVSLSYYIRVPYCIVITTIKIFSDVMKEPNR